MVVSGTVAAGGLAEEKAGEVEGAAGGGGA